MTFKPGFLYRTCRDRNYNWKARYSCSCGTEFEAYIDNVKRDKTKSCGCTRSDAVATHRLSHSLTYVSWQAMRNRCLNPASSSYPRYGGRGIAICEEWASFEQFLLDMGERPGKEFCIDRINNDGGYCKDNCRWLTRSENSRKSALLSGLGKH